MAKRIARFEKVTYEQFEQGWMDTFGAADPSAVQKIYEEIKLPKRATKGSAGYDQEQIDLDPAY